MPARRSISKPDQIAYHLTHAPLKATIADLVRVAGCRWKIEECSRARRTSMAWISTRSAATWAGTGTSRSPCSPTHSLAVMAVQKREKGVSRPTQPTSWTSRQPKSVVRWQLNPATILHVATTQ